jgi:hypothetical protein
VFIVGRSGKPCPPEILFEPARGRRHSASRGEAWPDIAVPLTSGVGVTGNAPGRRREDDFNIVSHALTDSGNGRFDPNGESYISTLQGGRNSGEPEPGSGIVTVIQDVRGGTRDRTDNGQGIGIREGGPCYTLGAVEQHAVAFAGNQRGEFRLSTVSPQLSCSGGKPGSGYPAVATLNSGGNSGGFRTDPGEHLVSTQADADGVRDFAGLPEGMDDSDCWPLLPRGEDSARYRALGNAVTVQVVEWIARQIIRYETKQKIASI